MTAQPIYCSNDHQAIADMMWTNLHNGDTVSYCMACTPAALRNIADTLDPPAAARVDAETGQDGQAAGAGARRPNGRRPRSRPAQRATVPTGADDQGQASPADDPSTD